MKNTHIQLNTKQSILVIGGRGFIGRHIVKYLENFGATVFVGSRCEQTPRQPRTRQVVLHDVQSVEDCYEFLNGIDVVVNAVGILRQR